ncbi:MAG TPA: fluoride efflux transporter CrcB [Gemmatimonadaceae bacterium]|jgi:CrcB protein|nr:fluoride efflux transporter CrcB [Gemmatimonadaceae bacterium]
MKPDWRMLAAVAIGGAIGSVARFVLNAYMQSRSSGPFPVGTLVINISGSALLGFIMQFSLETASVSPEIRVLLTTGFCGGFTTFSTFSYETVKLVQDGEYGDAGLYVGSSVLLSLLGTAAGMQAAHRVVASLRSRVPAKSAKEE